jgi:hypothetical protein
MALPTPFPVAATVAAASHTAEHLRRRALLLRALSRAVQQLDVLDLQRHAGTDVWVGPSQQHWDDTLRTDRAALLRTSRELHDAARRLERRADDLDRAGPPATGAVR